MAAEASSWFFYIPHRLKHKTCVIAKRRLRGVFDPDLSVLMTEKPLADMPFVWCEEEVNYIWRLRDAMNEVVGKEQPGRVKLSLWLRSKPYNKLHLHEGGRLFSRMLESESIQRTESRYAFVLGRHNVELFAFQRGERGKYYMRVLSFWRKMQQQYELSVPTRPVLSHYSGEVLKKRFARVLVMGMGSTQFRLETLVYFVS